MATSTIWNLGWLNANTGRNYPLSETATSYDVTNSIQIPNDFLVDMVLMVPCSILVDTSAFYVSSIALFSLGAVITISYNGAPAAVASVSLTGFTKNSSYRLVGTGTFADASGSVTVGSFDNFSTTTPGFYNFNLAGARLEPTVIKPDIRGVSSVSIINGTEQSAPLYGDVVLVAGQNVVFSLIPAQNAVRIDAQPTTSLIQTCICDTSASKPCVTTINGVGADPSGNITLQPNSCIAIAENQTEFSLGVSDTCSKPCCGCNELLVIQTDLLLLQSQAATLQNLANNLQGQLTQLSTSILASKVGAANPCA